MKIRLDYVTNSSASSFLVAKKEGSQLSRESRDKLAELLISKLIGDFTVFEGLTAENARTHEDMKYKDDDTIDKAVKALEDGFRIEKGMIDWEEIEYKIMKILSEALDIIDHDEGYRLIDGDLAY